MPERVRYRKLPGHRRGFIRGSSVWLGPDHLLAVNSMRFREEYKRYYFRDIQAIMIARKPRFHISTRAALIAYLWLIAFAATFRLPHGPALAGAAGVALVATWAYLSAARSCTCRIHTAVSQDTLPSVYRTWVARKFLREVEPEIAKVQGAWERPPAEAEAAEIGPPQAPSLSTPGTEPISVPEPRGSSFSFYLLLGGLFADALWHWFTLQHGVRWASAVSNLLGFFEIGMAVLILVQHRQRRIRPAQQKLAIATLVGTGLIFYGTSIGVASFANLRTATTKMPVDTRPALHVAEQINIGTTLALAVFGLAILVLDKPVRPGRSRIAS